MFRSFHINYISIFLVIFIIASCSKKVNYPIEFPEQSLAMDIITLSSDEMEGREIGTSGEIKAGDFLAKRFESIGLQPVGDDNTYFQQFNRKMSSNPHSDQPETGIPDIEGRNIIGYIDNNAKNTVIIGGHYDHLGYGHEGSLYTGERAIHNGADDNSSGTAGVLYLAESLMKSNFKNNNYLFICFSGEEKGLWGSNFFVNHTSMDKSKFNYMVNMDMIGRLNKERKLAISGVGTSATFNQILDQVKTPKFSLKRDSSGLGPSDHASFYNAGFPVLAFFTGQHSDYHKPSDDANLINYKGVKDIVQYIYNVIGELDKRPKQTFLKTRDESQTRMAFTVTLGVMPDYLYDEIGMKIDGVKTGKPAEMAGMLKGDIVVKMGELDVVDMQSYMKCLSIFKPGQKVNVKIVRDGVEMVKEVTF
jgi:hypothetical protein